jgi:hypothetical protein
MTRVSSYPSEGRRHQRIEDVPVDWERFVPQVRPIEPVAIDWDRERPSIDTQRRASTQARPTSEVDR